MVSFVSFVLVHAAAAARAAERVAEPVTIACEQEKRAGEVEIEGELEDAVERRVDGVLWPHPLRRDAVDELQEGERAGEDEVEQYHDDEEARDVHLLGDLPVEYAARAVLQRVSTAWLARVAHALWEHGEHHNEDGVRQKDGDGHGVPEVHDSVLGRGCCCRELGHGQRLIGPVVERLRHLVLPELWQGADEADAEHHDGDDTRLQGRAHGLSPALGHAHAPLQRHHHQYP